MSRPVTEPFAILAPLIALFLIFDRVTAFGMQSENYASHLRGLGVSPERVRVTGNVKYDCVVLDRDNPYTPPR